MILSLAIGALLGMVLAMPPGPVSVSTMKTGLDRGLKNGLMLALGAGALDVIYCSIAMLAATAVTTAVQEYFSNHPIALISFQSLCVIAMIVYGVLHLRARKEKEELEAIKRKDNEIISKLKSNGPFFIGVAIAITNIANPTFLPSLTYAVVFVKHLGCIKDGVANGLLFSLGFGLGNFLWLYCLLKVLLKYKSRMSPAIIARIHKFAGFSMISFGAVLGWKVLLDWKVLRIFFAF